jgi:hypothetical protein
MTKHPISHALSGAYVYAITVDGVVRYIGKGSGYRLREHLRIARLILNKRAVGKKIKVSRFYNRLAQAMGAKSIIDEIIFTDSLSDDAAFALEMQLIAEQQEDQLWNATLGGEGFTSQEARLAWTPERRARQSAIAKARWAKPGAREEHSQAIKAHWKRDEYRETHAEGRKQGETPEVRARRGVASKLKWANPEFRAKSMARLTTQWDDPAFREKHKKGQKEFWEKPGAREKHSLAQRTRWENA